MSKFDALLKRTTAYEKLAIYSDRKTFLQSLSQQNSFPMEFPTASMIDAVRPVAAKLSGIVKNISNQLQQSQDLNLLLSADRELNGGALQSKYISNESELKNTTDQLLSAIMNARSGAYALSQNQELSDSIKKYLIQISQEAAFAYKVVTNDPSVNKMMPQQEENPVGSNTSPQVSKWQGAEASAQYMTNKALETVNKLFDAKGPQSEQRKFQIQKALKPQIQYMLRMFNQAEGNKQLQQTILNGINKVYSALTYDDLTLIPEFEFGNLQGKLEKQMNFNENPY